MPSDRIELILFLAYALLGPLTWAGYGVVLFAGRRKMSLLKRPPKPLPGPPPRVTILIPAKDEEGRIRGCIESALKQDYPNFDVVCIDDRSTDRTGAIMDELAARDPRLKVIHLTEPPEAGWTGKNRALHVAQQHAAGEWMLFVDSDVVLEPDVLSASMPVVLRKKFDMLSLLPRLESETIWESLLVPLAAGAAGGMYLIALNNRQQLKAAFANGQFILVRRGAYDEIGGHFTLRDRLCEDMEMARLLKVRGLRPRIAWGNEYASVRMYDNLPAILRGWARIYYAGGVGSPWRIIAAALFTLLCTLSAYAALAWGVWRLFQPAPGYFGTTAAVGWLVAGGLHLLLVTWLLGEIYVWSGNPRRNALLFPLGGPMLLWIFGHSLYMCATKKVTWRGVAYSHTMDRSLAKTVAAAGATVNGSPSAKPPQ